MLINNKYVFLSYKKLNAYLKSWLNVYVYLYIKNIYGFFFEEISFNMYFLTKY